MMSMVIFFGLIALSVLELEYAVCAVSDPFLPRTFDVKVYPVGRWVNNFTVFWDKRTWLEAYESCISKNMIFHEGWKGTSFHDFVLAHALKENRSKFEGLWIGDYRPEGSSSWYSTNGCGQYDSGPDVIASTGGTLCNLLNATAHMEANVYAISCTQRHAYICSKADGYHKDSYLLHNNSKILDGSSFSRVSMINEITLEDCIFELLGTIGVIAEFRDLTNGRGTCEMFAYYAHELPIEVTLIDTTEEIITITGIQRFVLFDEDEHAVTTDGYPCSVNLPTAQTDTFTTFDTESTTKSMVFTTNMYEIITQTDEATNHNFQGADKTTNGITDIGSTVPFSVFCHSVCHCSGTINMTAEELQEILKNIRMVLKIDTTELSSNRRKKISAPDERLLSRSMGYVAVIVLVFIGSVIIISDLSNLSMYKSEKYEMK